MQTRQLLGLMGSIVLFASVFMPIVSIPILGEMTYLQNERADGMIILILASISLVLVLTKKYQGLWLTGLGSIGAMLFTFLHFQSKLAHLKTEMKSKVGATPFRALTDMVMQSVQLRWGWALLIVGTALVIASAMMTDEAYRDGAP